MLIIHSHYKIVLGVPKIIIKVGSNLMPVTNPPISRMNIMIVPNVASS